jgi:hypothetical protein
MRYVRRQPEESLKIDEIMVRGMIGVQQIMSLLEEDIMF